MTITKYETQVTKLGPITQDFIDEGILVFFQMNVPDELAEPEMPGDISVPGDAPVPFRR